jgi:hypothetical protein
VLVALALVGETFAVVQARPAVTAPVIRSAPADPSNTVTASFTFTAERGLRPQCSLDGGAFTSCTSPKRFTALRAGTHRFMVRARNSRGQLSAAAARTWRIDRTPPPAPVITFGPAVATTATTASFRFSDTERGVAFACRLDGGALATCASPASWSHLRAATHTFEVRAVDAAGNASTASTRTWTVREPDLDLRLAGDVAEPLYPGATAAVDVRITNPFPFDVEVSGLTVTVRRVTTRGGLLNPACDGTVNLRVARPYSGRWRLLVPARRTRSLSSLGVPRAQWPQLEMPNLPVNQDACKGTTFTFSYAATATKVHR